VGSLADLERDGRLIARLGGREVGVVRGPGGELHGLRNRCPHHGAPLCRGKVSDRMAGAPGHYELTSREIMRCPWHGWEFDLETGRSLLEPRRYGLRTFRVTEADGQVVLHT
jgi:3-phenylpropionate/trans-cinnamate dioxygenase ferredoxin subunit